MKKPAEFLNALKQFRILNADKCKQLVPAVQDPSQPFAAPDFATASRR